MTEPDVERLWDLPSRELASKLNPHFSGAEASAAQHILQVRTLIATEAAANASLATLEAAKEASDAQAATARWTRWLVIATFALAVIAVVGIVAG